MKQIKPQVVAVFEGSNPVLLARIKSLTATYILQSDISAIELKAFNEADNAQRGETETLDASQVIFDSLQTDDYWPEDGTGYNFRYMAPAAMITNGGEIVKMEAIITTTTGQKIPVVWRLDVQEVLSL